MRATWAAEVYRGSELRPQPPYVATTDQARWSMFLPDLWKVIWRRASRHVRGGHPDRAAGLLNRYVRLRPRDQMGWIMRGLLAKDHEGAPTSRKVEILREGVRRAGSGHDLSLSLGYALVHLFEETGDVALLEEARVHFQRQLEEQPSSPRPHLGLAFVAVAEERESDAFDYVNQARDRVSATADHPDGYDSYWAAIRLLLNCGREGRATAVGWLCQSSERHQGWAEPPLVLGVVLEREEPEVARRHLDEGRSRWSGSADDLEAYLEERREWIKGA